MKYVLIEKSYDSLSIVRSYGPFASAKSAKLFAEKNRVRHYVIDELTSSYKFHSSIMERGE